MALIKTGLQKCVIFPLDMIVVDLSTVPANLMESFIFRDINIKGQKLLRVTKTHLILKNLTI